MPNALIDPSRDPVEELAGELLTPSAVRFLTALHEEFDSTRKSLLRYRRERRLALSRGMLPDRLPATEQVRLRDWKVAECPTDLARRHVEITGPVDRKMMVNALNSGADCFMADFEDSLSPTWTNVIEGHRNVRDAVRGTLEFRDGSSGRNYTLGERTGTLLVRPRGWHLGERHQRVRGDEMSASLFDFGLHMFHNARHLLERGSGPYFYLPKIESHLEARLWNAVFDFAQDYLDIPRGTIRATVLVETIGAAFEMDEILFELREHASGLNAGRWDYIFSVIKTFNAHREFVLPDRDQVSMTVPFMQAYTDELVRTCHRRGAHAIGGMSAYIPSRRDPEANDRALAAVCLDKRREARQGFDGTWVAHPDLVETARGEFAAVMGERPDQKEKRPPSRTSAAELRDIRVPDGRITREGMRKNVRVALSYLSAWLQGRGAVAIDSMMEDAATAEISRAQLWQWVNHGVGLEDGAAVTPDQYFRMKEQELGSLGGSRLSEAGDLLDELVVGSLAFPDFFTLRAYRNL
jgi:malate synthase